MRIRWDNGNFIAVCLSLLAILFIVLSLVYWDELRGKEESLSTTLRNLGILYGTPFAIIFALWRSVTAQNQSNAAQEQARIAQQEAHTSFLSMTNDQYQRAAEMLGHGSVSVRLGGIHALENLAQKYVVQHGLQVTRLLCAFIRNPTVDPNVSKDRVLDTTSSTSEMLLGLRQDVQAALSAICRGTFNEHVAKYCLSMLSENDKNTLFDLHGADLRGANLVDAHLPKFFLLGANLSRAFLNNANLTGSNMRGANLSHSNLIGANLSGANLQHADLSYAKQSPENPFQ